jgi:hypothetical protein
MTLNSFVGDSPSLDMFAVEISYADTWINLNDGERYKISGEETRQTSTKQWRKIVATSTVLGGDYLVHAVPGMITEQVGVWVYGVDQTDMNDNLWFLMEMFEQFDFRLRWTTNEYREYWRCQLAEASSARGQVWTHSQMAQANFQVPRYPDVERERIE